MKVMKQKINNRQLMTDILTLIEIIIQCQIQIIIRYDKMIQLKKKKMKQKQIKTSQGQLYFKETKYGSKITRFRNIMKSRY